MFQQFSNQSLPKFVGPVKWFFLNYGMSGVQIFFLLSGFIILTLHINTNQNFRFWRFIASRYTRLLPGIFLLGIISIPILGIRQWFFSILPSVLIIDPSIFYKITGVENFSWFSTVMWTLFTEVRFYVIFGIVFTILRKKSLNLRLCVLLSILLVAKILFAVTQNILPGKILNLFFITNDSSYFIFGMILAIVYNWKVEEFTRMIIVMLLAVYLALSLIDSTILVSESNRVFFLLPLMAIFVLWEMNNPVIEKVAKYIGTPSYISYLIHLHLLSFYKLIGFNQNALIELLILPTSILALSYAIHLKIELPAIKYLRSKF